MKKGISLAICLISIVFVLGTAGAVETNAITLSAGILRTIAALAICFVSWAEYNLEIRRDQNKLHKGGTSDIKRSH